LLDEVYRLLPIEEESYISSCPLFCLDLALAKSA